MLWIYLQQPSPSQRETWCSWLWDCFRLAAPLAISLLRAVLTVKSFLVYSYLLSFPGWPTYRNDCMTQGSLEKQNIYTKKLIIWSGMHDYGFWQVYYLQVREEGSPQCSSDVWESEVLGAGEDHFLVQAEGPNWYAVLPYIFCSFLAFVGLSDASNHWGGPSALLSSSITRNNLTDIPEIMFN